MNSLMRKFEDIHVEYATWISWTFHFYTSSFIYFNLRIFGWFFTNVLTSLYTSLWLINFASSIGFENSSKKIEIYPIISFSTQWYLIKRESEKSVKNTRFVRFLNLFNSWNKLFSFSISFLLCTTWQCLFEKN